MVVRFIGMRNAIPAESQIYGKALVHPVIVLEIESHRNIAPVTCALDRCLVVVVGVTKQIIGEVVSGIEAAEDKCTLGLLKPILDLLIKHQAATHLELMPSLGPRNVITKLVVIRGVVPRGNTGSVIRSRAPNQIDGRDAVGGVRAGKESVEFEIGRGSDQAQRQKRDAISVIIEGNFIDQVRANDIGGMHNGCIGWIAEVGTDGRYIVAAEYGRTVALGDLFGHQMAVDRELVTYVFIDPDDFLSYVGRQIITANEAVAIGRCREDATIFPTGRQQGLGVAHPAGLLESHCY